MADTSLIPIFWYTNIIHKTATNSTIITLLNGFASLFIKTEMGTLLVGMGLIKPLWLHISIASWLIAHFTVLFILFTGFFQMFHCLYDIIIVTLTASAMLKCNYMMS